MMHLHSEEINLHLTAEPTILARASAPPGGKSRVRSLLQKQLRLRGWKPVQYILGNLEGLAQYVIAIKSSSSKFPWKKLDWISDKKEGNGFNEIVCVELGRATF